jgi:type II secretory pathway component PulF
MADGRKTSAPLYDRPAGAVRAFSSSIAWIAMAVLLFSAGAGIVALLLNPETAFVGVAAACIIVIAFGNSARLLRRRRARVILAYVAQAVQMNLPISTLLEAAARSETPPVAQRIDRLGDALENGLPVGSAVAIAVPQVPQRVVDLADSAQANGHLPQVLARLLDEHYPPGRDMCSLGFYGSYSLILLLMLSAVIALLSLFIVPKYEQILRDFNVTEPAVTVAVMSVGQSFAPCVCIFAVVITLIAEGRALRRLLSPTRPRTNPLGSAWDHIAWRTPVLRTLAQNRGLADACEMMAAAVEAGRPVDQTIAQAAQPHLNAVLRDRLRDWGALVAEGLPLGEAADRAQLPALIGGLTGSAVRAGNLSAALRFLAGHYESSFSRAAILFQAAAVPAVVISLGAAVMAVALALFEPMLLMIQAAAHYTRYW